MKIWITKYALTRGIVEVEMDAFKLDGGYIYSKDDALTMFAPGQWYADYAFAVSRAEEMRKKKIASLEKQIERLRKLEF